MRFLILTLSLVLFSFSQEVKVYVIVKGKVEKVFVRKKERVKRGELLMRIDPSLYEARRTSLLGKKREIEAKLWKVERDFKRLKELFERNLLAETTLESKKIEYDTLKAKLQQVEGELKEIETLISYTEIRAPLNGWVKEILVPEGNYVNGSLQPQAVMVIQSED